MESTDKAQTRSPSATPLPIRKITVLGMVLAANNTSIWMIFSFLPFMVKHFYPDMQTNSLGFEAGILGSAFSCGGLLGNVLWGYLSERIGRRPSLLCGLLGTAISCLCFGFSPNYLSAVLSRFMWGVLNGNVGIAKTYLAEISDDSNFAKGMAAFGVIGGVGRTVGPIIGGLLSQPAESYPSIFRNTVFDQFPFALPSLAIFAYTSLVMVLAYCELPETKKSLVQQYMPLSVTESENESDSNDGVEGDSKYLQADGDDVAIDVEKGHRIEDLPKRKRVSFASTISVKVIGSSRIAFGKLKQVSDDDDGFQVVAKSSPVYRPVTYPLAYSNGSEHYDSIVDGEKSFFYRTLRLFRYNEVRLSTSLYGITSLMIIVASEVFPLWAVISIEDGGFAYSSYDIGLVTMICGLVAIAAQISVYPAVVHKYGVLKTFRLGIILFAISCLILPNTSKVTSLNSSGFTTTIVTFVQAVLNVSATWVMISVFVLINNSCYSKDRASVNIIGQTFASIGRLIGPYIGSIIFAWSETNDLTWPFNYYFVFYCVAIVAILSYFTATYLPNSIEKRKKDPLDSVSNSVQADEEDVNQTGGISLRRRN